MERPSSAAPNFRALFEASPNLYLVISPDFKIVAVNTAYAQATMTCPEEIVGRNLFDVFPDNPNDASATGESTIRASLDRVLRLRRPDIVGILKYDIPKPASAGGGFEERYWAPVNTPVLDEGGEVAWIIHRVEDVTETVRRQELAAIRDQHIASQTQIIERLQYAEEELRDTKNFLNAIIENLPGMLFVKDARNNAFVLYNHAGEELTGYSRDEVIGKNDYDLFPREQAERFVAFDRDVLAKMQTLIMPEEPITTRRNGTRLLQTTKVPVVGSDGNPQYILGFAEDVTERRAIEQQLRQALKMEAVGQLTGGIAHDFNNLLGVIIGNLDMSLELASADPAMLECLQECLAGAQRGAELTRRLLAFSRVQTLRPSVINVNDILPQIANMLRRTLGEQITIEFHPAPDLRLASIDRFQLEEAILNLAINARDAMPAGGILTIETANVHLDRDYASQHAEVQPGSYVMLSVSDSGVGMPPDVVERVFEPFFTTKEPDKGSGLGLSMVYGFVKQSDGHIKIYSELRYGTSVKIYLPCSDDMPTAKSVVDDQIHPHAQPNECVLVVEDNPSLRLITVKQLTDLGYRVLEADSAYGGLDMLARHGEIDIVLSDIVMPGGMSGADLAASAGPLYPKLKILLMTGYARAMASGLADIDGVELIMKPFRKHELAVAMRNLLDRPS